MVVVPGVALFVACGAHEAVGVFAAFGEGVGVVGVEGLVVPVVLGVAVHGSAAPGAGCAVLVSA